MKICIENNCNSDAEYRARCKPCHYALMKEYRQRPSVKEKTIAYRQKQDVKAKANARWKNRMQDASEKKKETARFLEYSRRPEVIERVKKYNQCDDVKAKRKEALKEYGQRPHVKAQRYIASEKYRKKNISKYNAYIAARRAKKVNATPSWANMDIINNIYCEARKITLLSGVMHHVDHIIPLINDIVCGLHVGDNLQILTQSENCKKSNSFTSFTARR